MNEKLEHILSIAERAANELRILADSASDALLQNAQSMIQGHFVSHITIMALTILVGLFLYDKIKNEAHQTILVILSILASIFILPQCMFMSASAMGWLQVFAFIATALMASGIVHHILLIYRSSADLEKEDDHVIE